MAWTSSRFDELSNKLESGQPLTDSERREYNELTLDYGLYQGAANADPKDNRAAAGGPLGPLEWDRDRYYRVKAKLDRGEPLSDEERADFNRLQTDWAKSMGNYIVPYGPSDDARRAGTSSPTGGISAGSGLASGILDQSAYNAAKGHFGMASYYTGQADKSYGDLLGRYRGQLDELEKPIDMNDPYLSELMRKAGLSSMQNAKMRGVQGPYSINAGERSRYLAGLNYYQGEKQRRDTLRAQMMGQYGSGIAGQSGLAGNANQTGQGLGNLSLGKGSLELGANDSAMKQQQVKYAQDAADQQRKQEAAATAAKMAGTVISMI